MPQVSKRKINPKTQFKIDEALVKIFARIGTTTERENFLAEFLTPTEKLMLAKRLALIALTMQGYSLTQTEEILGISHVTSVRYLKRVAQGHFPLLRKIVRNKNKKKTIDEWVDLILRAGGVMPPRGRGRWRALYKIR